MEEDHESKDYFTNKDYSTISNIITISNIADDDESFIASPSRLVKRISINLGEGNDTIGFNLDSKDQCIARI